MKTRELLLLASLLALSFYSCDNDKEPDFKSKEKYVSFSGSIAGTQTRASETNWGSGDAIGVYMKTAGSSLSTGSLADNVKYTTPGNGNFSAATTGIELPANGDRVDFVAYYPYLSSQTGVSLAFSVADQSSQPDIDVLYSNNAVNADKTNGAVGLNFKHQLSQLILNITAGDGISSLTGMTLSMTNARIKGNLNLEDGTVTSDESTSTLVFSPVITGTTASVQAILMPGQDLNSTPITFVVEGRTYEWTPSTQVLESGKKYTYPIQLSRTGVVALNPTGTITDWVDANPGGTVVVITPNEETEFKADKTAVTFAAAASNEAILLTAASDQAWTTAVADSWLTVNPSAGTGSATLTLTAEANTTTAQRSTTVTITPTGSTLTAVTITVTQESGGSGATLLFPGSDFEDWSAFTGSLNGYGLKADYTEQSTDGGRNASSALYLNGTPTGNDYVFTAVAGNGTLVSGSRIVFYIKGTSTKSLSMNVYSTDGVAAGYYKFNLGDCTGDVTIDSSVTNSYTGVINTNGQWAKVTLNITGISLTTSGSYFALKVGKDVAYDLYVDDITIE